MFILLDKRIQLFFILFVIIIIIILSYHFDCQTKNTLHQALSSHHFFLKKKKSMSLSNSNESKIRVKASSFFFINMHRTFKSVIYCTHVLSRFLVRIVVKHNGTLKQQKIEEIPNK